MSEIEAIVGGWHGDPFSVLGPHRAGEGWEVRAFLPWAKTAEVLLSNGRRVPMERQHDEGFFVAPVDHEPGHYRLRGRTDQGFSHAFEDPYRFPPLLSDFDLHLFAEGTNYESYNLLGAHAMEVGGVPGVRFAVWAPHAECVLLAAEFNHWNLRSHPMRRREGGVWEIFIANVKPGERYKYFIRSQFNGYRVLKADPYAFTAELPPSTASVVADRRPYDWADASWMERRAKTHWLQEAVNVYEVHLESWLRGEHGKALSYRELADKLVPYLQDMGYTHLELLPIMEHPFAGSWGYQVTGYFAPTSRFGPPEDFKYFVDRCHQAGIGVILDWVPGHFPRDEHGLHYFDGTFLYEHEDPRVGEHKEWGTLIFNYGRNEVLSFLLSSAMWWLKEYHVDGFRVDAVASMLYLDYCRNAGEWLPNKYGGRENLEAIEFLKRFNLVCHQVPGVITIAEESTDYPMVSRPVYLGGLGFDLKWNMGWMHDMFRYFKLEPIHRRFHHNDVTFSLMYSFNENYLLPISHDEVVHGKATLLAKMPGDEWQRFANCRAFLAYMYGHPGKKLLFMGQEIGQYDEFNEKAQVRWDLLQFDYHRQLRELVKTLNRMVREEPALRDIDFHWDGFEWLDFTDYESSVISFVRKGKDPRDQIVFVCNFTPNVRHHYRIGMPAAGVWEEILNTDASWFGGSGVTNGGDITTDPVPMHGRDQSVELTLPPLAVMAYRLRRPPREKEPLKEKEAPVPVPEEVRIEDLLTEDDIEALEEELAGSPT